MFLSLEQPVVITLIAIIAAQYAFATFCLMKLATLDLPRKNYVLWNLFILLVFFIGGIVFLVYYSKAKNTKTVPPFVPPVTEQSDGETTASEDGAPETAEETEGEDNTDDNSEQDTPENPDEANDLPADSQEQA